MPVARLLGPAAECAVSSVTGKSEDIVSGRDEMGEGSKGRAGGSVEPEGGMGMCTAWGSGRWN